MTTMTSQSRAGMEILARRIITGWALLGGLVLLAVVAINSYSILAGAIFNRPFAGDFELTEMGAAIAAFCFLPYCQLTGANVSADIFTLKAGPRSLALMSLLAAFIAATFAGILLWRMSAGLIDYREYEEFTGILSIPIWWAFIPALMSLVLLVIAALITLREAISALRRSRSL